MKKRMVCFALALLFFSAWLPAPPAQAVEADPTVRIGLFYGSGALPAANLQNVTGYGSGYAIGYYDRDQGSQFHPLFETSVVEITVVKDKLIYISGGKDYSDVAPASASAVIGPYHLQVGRTFSSWQEAASFSQGVSAAPAFPAYSNGSYVVRIGQYATAADAQAAAPAVSAEVGEVSAAGYSSTCYTVTATGTNTILFEFDQNGTPMGIQPQGAHTQTWFKGYKYYGGFEYNRINGNDLTVVNVVSLNDYVKGVVPYEMSPSWPVEALKAQAVCARTYCVDNLNKHKSQGFDLCNTTDCQVYRGTNTASATSDSAVDATYGQYVTYDGKIAETYYHASSGGATEDVENIWNAYVPYLRGVQDTYLTNVVNWSATLTNDTVAAILRDKGYTVSGVTNVYVSDVTRNGNVDGLTVERAGDTPLVFTKEKARTALNSPSRDVSFLSHRYTIDSSGGTAGAGGLYVNDQAVGSLSGLYAIGKGGNVAALEDGAATAITGSGTASVGGSMAKTAAGTGVYTVKGTGNGHHVGMSQWGANGMAVAGFGYEDIIKFYFTGVQVGPAA